MNQYDFGSIQVKSLQLKMILDEISRIDIKGIPQFSFFVIGELGSGKNTMAQYVRKNVFKNRDILIQRNIAEASAIKPDAVIVTTTPQNWIKIRSEICSHKYHIIVMPNLKDRKEDLLNLADFFLQVFSLMNGRPQLKLTPQAAEMILQYSWPGQFYEFESVLEGAFEVATKNSVAAIEPQFFVFDKLPAKLELNVGMKLQEIERNFILQTLYFAHQNRTKAAEILGISIRTLRNKINQYRTEGYL